MPMLEAGWTPRPDAGAICGYEGTGTVFLTPARWPPTWLPLSLQRARRSADPGCQHDARLQQGECGDGALRVLVRLATGRHAASLQWRHVRECRCDERRELGRARPLQRGRLGDRTDHVPCQQRRLLERVGDALRPDRARARSQRPHRHADRALGTGPVGGVRSRERRARPLPMRSTAGARVGLRGQACSWLCGAGASGSSAIDLASLGDGPHCDHRLRAVVCRRRRQRRPDGVHGRSHSARAAADPRRTRCRGPGDRMVGARTDRALALIRHRGRRRGHDVAPLRAVRRARVFPVVRRCAGPRVIPASALGRTAGTRWTSTSCDAAGHCTTSPRAGFHWDGRRLPPRRTPSRLRWASRQRATAGT